MTHPAPSAPNSAGQPAGPAAGGAAVLVISHDVVGAAMAGPGIRYFHLARVLAQHFPVVLAVPPGSTLTAGPGFRVLPYDGWQSPVLEAAIQQARVVVVSAVAVAWIPGLSRAGVPLAIDGHNPFQAETFYLRPGEAGDQAASLTPAYLQGDFFFCASQRQRDWWLGLLEANGRLNAHTHDDDPTLRRLIDLVPFGVPAEPPVPTRPALKGVRPGIGPADKVLLWGGGLWPWLDPLTAIRAVARLRPHRPEVRLVLPAAGHPNPAMAAFPTLLEAARTLAGELGLLDTAIFFVDWAPYADWPNVLLESDVALTLHPRGTLESRLAFRTRVLDYLWAGLPVVAARGDVMADLVAEHGLGVVVEPEDPAQVAAAVLQLLDLGRAGLEARFAAVRSALQWETVARPLVEFCRAPRWAPDKLARGARLGNPYYTRQIAQLEQEVARLSSLVRYYEDHRGVRLLRRLDPLVLRLGWLRRRVNHG